MSIKETLKQWMPPIVPRLPILRNIFSSLRGDGFSGDYKTFEAAVAECGAGYTAENVIESILKRTLDAKSHQEKSTFHDDRFYRMGFAFLHARMAIGANAPLHVLDFGGSLGGHFFAMRSWLGEPLTWTVVETEPMAKAGTKHLANESLRFASDLNLVKDRAYHLVLASGSLQYLPDPHAKLRELFALGSQYLVVDRVPILQAERDRLMIQKINPKFYRASFPAWFLSERSWRKTMTDKGGSILLEWDVPEDSPYIDGKRTTYKGFTLARSC